jgi:hypothetical protein
MLDAQIFSWFQTTFHINGFATMVARFINKYLGISYNDYYEDLFAYAMTNEWLKKEEAETRQYFANWMNTGRINHPKIGVEIHGWNIIHRTSMNMHQEDRVDELYDVLEKFLERYNLPEDLLASLMKLQRNYYIKYNDRNQYPMNLEVDYNIWDYLSFNQPLEKTATTYRLDFPEDKTMSLNRFLELFYFARRRNFGKATVDRIGGKCQRHTPRCRCCQSTRQFLSEEKTTSGVMSRLFTFGCSFTNYRWSTWADCLAPEFDYFENWGQSGGGNHYIFNSSNGSRSASSFWCR